MPTKTKVAVVGVPSDENSTYLTGAADAPGAIREALHLPSSNLCAEDGLDLGESDGWEDAGDLSLPGGGRDVAAIEAGISDLLGHDRRVVALGGDHAVTAPIIRATARLHPDLTILHLDAHPDLYDEYEGSRNSHACPFARIMEEGLARRLVQVGIRGANPHQRAQAERFGVEMHGAGVLPPVGDLRLEPPLYLSIDMDVLDPAFAPGVSHPEPGGLSTREVISIIQDLPVSPVGADIVEVNPRRDPQGLSASVAAKLLKEVLGGMLAPARA